MADETTQVDVNVLIYDIKADIDTYTLDPRPSDEEPGKYNGIFTWNESSFYPEIGLTNPGLKINFDREVTDIVPSKYFKSGIGASNSLKLIKDSESLVPGAIDLELEHGSVYLFKENIPIASTTSIGVAVRGTSIPSFDTVPVNLTIIGLQSEIYGTEHFIADVSSKINLYPIIEQKWSHVSKFSGVAVSGVELDTYIGPLQYRNIDTDKFEYLIYNLPERSTTSEAGYKVLKQLPELATGLNTLTNFLLDPITGKVISYDMLVSGTDASYPAPANLRVIKNPFGRQDIFNQLVTDVPNAAGEYAINFTTGTLTVYVDPLYGAINFPGTVDFYTYYPSYIIFNQDVNRIAPATGAHTYSTLSSYVVNVGNITALEKLNSAGVVGQGQYLYSTIYGGISGIRVFKYKTTVVTAVTELTEYIGDGDIPANNFRIDKYSGMIAINITGAANEYDIYAMYNYGPCGHVERLANATVKYSEIPIVQDYTSNNNGYIILASGQKELASLNINVLSAANVLDSVNNIYEVGSGDVIGINVCAKSSSGIPVPGIPINLENDGSFEIVSSTGNTDRNGCTYFVIRAFPSSQFFIDVPWYSLTPQSNPLRAYFDGGTVATGSISLKGTSVSSILLDDMVNNPEDYIVEIFDYINPGPYGLEIKTQYPLHINIGFDTGTDVDTGLEEITVVAHGLVTGDLITYNKLGGVAVIGLTDATNYYVRRIDVDTLAFYATLVDANADTNRIDLTAAGAETHYIKAAQTATKIVLANAPLNYVSSASDTRIGYTSVKIYKYNNSVGTIDTNGAIAQISFDTTADVNAGTDVVAAALHGYSTGDTIKYVADGVFDMGLVDGTIYYVRAVTAGTLAFYSTYLDATADTNRIALTSGGAETHYINCTIKITHPDFRSYMTGQRVYTYKSIANQNLSPAEITGTNPPEFTSGLTIAIQKPGAATRAIAGFADDGNGKLEITIGAGDTYLAGEIMILTGTTDTNVVVGEATAVTIDGSVVTFTTGNPNIVSTAAMTVVYNGVTFTNNGTGKLTSGTPGTYRDASIDYVTGDVVIRKISGTAPAGNAVSGYTYTATYDGAYPILSVGSSVLYVLDTDYNSVISVAGAAIRDTDKYEILDADSVIEDGTLFWDIAATSGSTGIPDVNSYGKDANGMYPFEYRFLLTHLENRGYFTAKDPFSGKIISSDTFTLVTDLPQDSQGAFIFNDKRIGIGAYLT